MLTIVYRLWPPALIGVVLLGSCGFLNRENEAKDGRADSTYFRATLNGQEEWSGKSDAAFSQQGRIESWLSISADSVDEKKFSPDGEFGVRCPISKYWQLFPFADGIRDKRGVGAHCRGDLL